MKIQIVSERENPLLKRKEIRFEVKHDKTGSTPPRREVRKALANTIKAKSDFVIIKRLKTKTGTRTAVGFANVYVSSDQARLVEPDYIIARNIPREKTEAEKEE